MSFINLPLIEDFRRGVRAVRAPRWSSAHACQSPGGILTERNLPLVSHRILGCDCNGVIPLTQSATQSAAEEEHDRKKMMNGNKCVELETIYYVCTAYGSACTDIVAGASNFKKHLTHVHGLLNPSKAFTPVYRKKFGAYKCGYKQRTAFGAVADTSVRKLECSICHAMLANRNTLIRHMMKRHATSKEEEEEDDEELSSYEKAVDKRQAMHEDYIDPAVTTDYSRLQEEQDFIARKQPATLFRGSVYDTAVANDYARFQKDDEDDIDSVARFADGVSRVTYDVGQLFRPAETLSHPELTADEYTSKLLFRPGEIEEIVEQFYKAVPYI
jgi:hypothetical protein